MCYGLLGTADERHPEVLRFASLVRARLNHTVRMRGFRRDQPGSFLFGVCGCFSRFSRIVSSSALPYAPMMTIKVWRVFSEQPPRSGTYDEGAR